MLASPAFLTSLPPDITQKWQEIQQSNNPMKFTILHRRVARYKQTMEFSPKQERAKLLTLNTQRTHREFAKRLLTYLNAKHLVYRFYIVYSLGCEEQNVQQKWVPLKNHNDYLSQIKVLKNKHWDRKFETLDYQPGSNATTMTIADFLSQETEAVEYLNHTEHTGQLYLMVIHNRLNDIKTSVNNLLEFLRSKYNEHS